jgi:serine/threonine protein phosphatase PrpC
VEVLCRDHNCDHEDERERITKQGGMVVYDSEEEMYRVQGVLAVSRAFGNAYFKPFVSHVPEIHDQILTDAHRFLCIASDGLWECVKNDEVGPILIKHGIDAGTEMLAQLSFARGGTDNITVMCVDLHGAQGGAAAGVSSSSAVGNNVSQSDKSATTEEGDGVAPGTATAKQLSRAQSIKRKRA